jgi:hypothetical protein
LEITVQEDLVILKGYIEGLNLHRKSSLELSDWIALKTDLQDAGEYGLALWVDSLQSPGQLEEFIRENLQNEEEETS